MDKAIQTAQEIINLIAERRPKFINRQVVSLTVSPPTEALHVTIYLDDQSSTTVTGLWAHEIVRHLPETPML